MDFRATIYEKFPGCNFTNRLIGCTKTVWQVTTQPHRWTASRQSDQRWWAFFRCFLWAALLVALTHPECKGLWEGITVWTNGPFREWKALFKTQNIVQLQNVFILCKSVWLCAALKKNHNEIFRKKSKQKCLNHQIPSMFKYLTFEVRGKCYSRSVCDHKVNKL